MLGWSDPLVTLATPSGQKSGVAPAQHGNHRAAKTHGRPTLSAFRFSPLRNCSGDADGD